MTERWRRGWAWRVDRRLRWGAGAALLLLVLLQVGSGGVLHQLGRANLGIALPAIAGLVAVHLLGALTWWLLQARVGGWAPEWSGTLQTYYVAQAIGGMTPANLGSDVYRLAAAPPGQRWSVAALPILIQRVGSTAALAALGAIGLSIISLRVAAVGWVIGGSVALVAMGIAAAVVLRRRGVARGRGMLRVWVGTAAMALGLGVAFHSASLLLSLALVASITPVDDPILVLAALAGARLSLLVPITPSGLGLQEGLQVILFAGIGLTGDVALATSLLSRVGLLATTLLGASLLLGGHSGRMKPVAGSAGGDPLAG